MRREAFVVRPEQRKSPLSVVGTNVTVLVSDAGGDGQQITVQSGNEGTGPPPHSHGWDESFYVTRGQIEFVCDGKVSMCPAGTLVHVPAGTVHAFRYAAGGGEMIEITGRSSNAVDMFTALDRDIAPGPLEVDKVVAVLDAFGCKVHL